MVIKGYFEYERIEFKFADQICQICHYVNSFSLLKMVEKRVCAYRKSFLTCESAAINAVQTCIYENEVSTRSISVEFTATYCPVSNIKLVYMLYNSDRECAHFFLCQSFREFFHKYSRRRMPQSIGIVCSYLTLTI